MTQTGKEAKKQRCAHCDDECHNSLLPYRVTHCCQPQYTTTSCIAAQCKPQPKHPLWLQHAALKPEMSMLRKLKTSVLLKLKHHLRTVLLSAVRWPANAWVVHGKRSWIRQLTVQSRCSCCCSCWPTPIKCRFQANRQAQTVRKCTISTIPQAQQT